LVHLRVRERDPSVAAPVGGEPDQPAVEAELVPARLRHVDYLGLGRRAGRGFELVGSSEELDQLSGGVRLARVAMLEEAAAVGAGELPRLALPQVREDGTRAPVELAVLGFENRDLIG